MEAHSGLASSIRLKLLTLAGKYAKECNSGTFVFNEKYSGLALENGEQIVGYQFLNGVNPYFEISGSVSVTHSNNQAGRNTATVSFNNLNFTWHDRMDPNRKYSTDQIKSVFGKIVSRGKAKDYDISIEWGIDTLTISFDDNGEIDTTKIPSWPFKVTAKRPPLYSIPQKIIQDTPPIITGPPYFQGLWPR